MAESINNLPANMSIVKPWDRQHDETDKAYEAFCIYLNMPKRENGERTQEDVAKHFSHNRATIAPWFRKYRWAERAKAYDDFISFKPAEIAELAHRRELADDLRSVSKKLRVTAQTALDGLDPTTMKATDVVALIKCANELDEKVHKIEGPQIADKKNKIKSELGRVLKQLSSGGVAGLVGGSSGGVLTASERTISLQLPDGGDESVCEIQDMPGEICEGSFESEPLGEAD